MIELRSKIRLGEASVQLSAVGGAVLSCEIAGRRMLRSVAESNVRSRLDAASFACLPYFGRLEDVRAPDGARHRLLVTEPMCDPSLAIHGEGWISEWEVAEVSSNAALLRLYYRPGRPGGWPWPFLAEQRFTLDDGGFRSVLTLRNLFEGAAPAGLAFHPYFERSADTRVAFGSDGFWRPPMRAGETGSFEDYPDEFGRGAPSPLPDRLRDHTYAGFGGEAVIFDAGGPLARLTTDAASLHCYAPPGEDYFCLEPVTHLPGKFPEYGDIGGAQMLAPNDSVSLSMTIAPA